MEDTIVVAVEDVSDHVWLQAADVIVGRHRTRRAGRRWISTIRRRYPGCVVAVTRGRRGRWCLVGWPGHTAVMRGEHMDVAMTVEIGCVAYYVWTTRGVRP